MIFDRLLHNVLNDLSYMVNPINISEAALEQIKEIKNNKNIPADYGLRVGVQGAGCSGVSYVLGFDQKSEKDLEFEIEGVPLFIEKKDIMHLMGVELDFISDNEVSGFHFNTND